MDAKYGRQFSVETFEETLPATVYGIEKCLGSGLVKGIGSKYAKRIVQEFGERTLEAIEDSPDDLIRVPGIGRGRVERIKRSWAEQKESSRAITRPIPPRYRFSRPCRGAWSAQRI